MTDVELDTLRDWAVAEVWNPGISDIAIARKYDPEAFIALRRGGVQVWSCFSLLCDWPAFIKREMKVIWTLMCKPMLCVLLTLMLAGGFLKR